MELKNKRFFVYGFSMGAVASIEAQSKKPVFDAMILDCPFDSSENVLKKCLGDIKFSLFGYELSVPGRHLLEKYAFHPYVQAFVKVLLKAIAKLDPKSVDTHIVPFYPVESIKHVSVPCFFIHCKRDEKVPASSIKAIYEGASGPKKLWLTNGRSHFDSYFYNPEKYVERVRGFLSEVIQGKWKSKTDQVVLEDDEDSIVG